MPIDQEAVWPHLAANLPAPTEVSGATAVHISPLPVCSSALAVHDTDVAFAPPESKHGIW